MGKYNWCLNFAKRSIFKIYFNGNCFFISYTSRSFSLLYNTNDSSNEKKQQKITH